MADQKPSIGRIVHYQLNGEPRAAIITAVSPSGSVDLYVLTPTNTYHHLDAPFSAEPKPGHWNWPPKVG